MTVRERRHWPIDSWFHLLDCQASAKPVDSSYHLVALSPEPFEAVKINCARAFPPEQFLWLVGQSFGTKLYNVAASCLNIPVDVGELLMMEVLAAAAAAIEVTGWKPESVFDGIVCLVAYAQAEYKVGKAISPHNLGAIEIVNVDVVSRVSRGRAGLVVYPEPTLGTRI
ncbi:hypothetical protein F0M18_13585 [Pseudohalioglobus sediminis]|uniref:Uncharacterized protein n=1 Tax=Pseudohalioglobus sediminis TaxID=2606449 RepID=A0A5B0WSP5_9GAMM|nr:hypothetical protein [Pseudohalioglobus sediminis]KAA1190092.1 hypothetical protein F0M18_13585 [Pseudohalioglobus sediminis]